ncbi:MAG: hypothetical protein HQM16_02795, partial [Deltaproteobacteria bacterium]|nr:hypothetical protein [Deltaproteobacteria bacterium]
MRVINPEDITKQKYNSLKFCEGAHGLEVIINAKIIRVKDLYDQIGSMHPHRFRGALVYSREQFLLNLKAVSDTISKHIKDFRIYWAVKSAPLKELVEGAAKSGFGFDVGSTEELMMAVNAGALGRNICHTAAAKFDWDIDAIVKHDCLSITDNLTELSLLNERAKALGKRARVGIRVNPSVQSETASIISTGRADCKFGIPDLSNEYLDQFRRFKYIDIQALHMHIGHQIANPDNYIEAVGRVTKIYKLFSQNGFTIKIIDVGGGFPYQYTESQEFESVCKDQHSFPNYVRYDFETYIKKIKEKFTMDLQGALPTIAFEPGNIVTAGTAFALGYVLNTKIYPNGLRWVMVSI